MVVVWRAASQACDSRDALPDVRLAGRPGKSGGDPGSLRITAFRLNYCLVRVSVRNVTDPFLLSASGDAPLPAAPADRIGKLTRRVRVPRTMLEDMPPEDLDRMEQSAARMQARQERWGDLADAVAQKLTAAGFRRHEAYGKRGGFCLSMWEDGLIVGWSAADYAEDMVSPFEKMVERAILPALEQILQASGFTARIIPEAEDNGGDIRVTGWQGPGGIEAAAEQ